MAAPDLFSTYKIPPEVSERIFFLAGPAALTRVRCTSHANAEAYEGVALSLAKRGEWACNASTPAALEVAEDNRLPRICINQANLHSLPTVVRFEWLQELYLDARSRRKIVGLDEKFKPYAHLAISRLPPQLVLFSCAYLGLEEMPVLPDSLERLTWYEGYMWDRSLAGPLPSSLRLLHVHIHRSAADRRLHPNAFFFDLPSELPPALEALHIVNSPQRTGTLPPLPPALKRLRCINADLTRLPPLPSTLVDLTCSGNKLTALPPLPAGLRSLMCLNNRLVSLLPMAVPQGML